jgi:tetratricopeptide (TPR) repeat protein
VADEPGKVDLDLGPEDAGVAFRIEMWATDTLMRWWRELIGAVVLVLLGVLVYGQYQSMVQQGQRSTTSSIADVETELSAPLIELAASKAGLTGQALDEAKTADAAAKLLAISESASGTAQVEAALKAAELFRLTGNAENRRKALNLAAEGSEGVLRYAALSGLATLDLEEGQSDAALGRYRELQHADDFLARRATLDLAATLEAIERPGEAVKAYEEYLTRWPQAADRDDVQARRDKAAGQGG